jgi:hypothetical protein
MFKSTQQFYFSQSVQNRCTSVFYVIITRWQIPSFVTSSVNQNINSLTSSFRSTYLFQLFDIYFQSIFHSRKSVNFLIQKKQSVFLLNASRNFKLLASRHTNFILYGRLLTYIRLPVYEQIRRIHPVLKNLVMVHLSLH